MPAGGRAAQTGQAAGQAVGRPRRPGPLWAVGQAVGHRDAGFIRSRAPLGGEGATRSRKLQYDFCTGLLAGSVATCANTPTDVAKSRIQAQLGHTGLGRYRGTWGSLRLIYREEGVRGCYKGLAARLYRAAPGVYSAQHAAPPAPRRHAGRRTD